MVPPTPRREIPASIAPPDPRCHRCFRKRHSHGVKGGRRPRCRGSKSKKFCKKRRKLRGPTPKLGFGTDATRRTPAARWTHPFPLGVVPTPSFLSISSSNATEPAGVCAAEPSRASLAGPNAPSTTPCRSVVVLHGRPTEGGGRNAWRNI
eukprot:scaffold62084_cov103-Phaeocystis_antarctica.AAC.1